MAKQGFTLIELIVVIAIIAVLAAVVAPNAFKAIDKAKISNVISSYKNIKTASAQYYGDTGQWPVTCNNYVNCTSSGFLKDPGSSVVTGWDGPYLDKWPVYPYGTGNITYTNATTGVFNASAAPERYVSMPLTNTVARSKIDVALDGTDSGTTGTSRYDSNGMNLLINRDGPVD